MFEGLDDVDWHALKHAYGPADDVPECIRDLASENADVRRQAMNELFGNIYHQGTVYEATAYAVPFLIELAAAPSIMDRDHVLVLLAAIFNGSSYNAAHQRLGLFAKDREKPEFKRQMERELHWVRDAKDAVGVGVPVYRGCLQDPNPDVRLMAAYVIGTGSPPSHESFSALEAQFAAETNVSAQAGLVLALADVGSVLGIRDERLVTRIMELFRDSKPLVTKVSCAIALAKLKPDSAPEQAIDILVGAICQSDRELEEAWCSLPWNHGRLTVDAGVILAQSFDNPDAYLDHIENALRERGLTADCDVAIGILQAAFGDDYVMYPADPPPFASLSRFQRRALRFIAEADRAWTYADSIGCEISARGFPFRRQEFTEYVNS